MSPLARRGATSRPGALRLVLAVLAGLASCGDGERPAGPVPPPADATGADRPNVLVVYCDDLRHDGLSAAGNPWIETPALDRIADEGVRFERAYASTSRCAPSRASFLTGLLASEHGIWGNKSDVDLGAAHTLFPELLRAAGYATAWLGKWHLPNPGARPVPGFDHWAGYEGPGSHFDQTFVVDGVPTETQGFQSDVLTDLALAWLARPERADAPWFLVVSHKAPHVPMTPAPEFAGSLAGADIPLPVSARDPLDSLPARYRYARSTDDRKRVVLDEPAWRADVRAYWELVRSVDRSTARLLADLEARGWLADTLVVLTSDNGQLLGEHGLKQKGLAYEPSIRVPLCLRGPGVGEPGLRRGLALNVDLAPTILAACGVPVPEVLQGASLLPELADPDAPVRERFLYLAPGFGGEDGLVERAVVERDWKYVRFEEGTHREAALFHLAEDPDERVDLAGDPAHAATLARLSDWMDAELERLGLE